jgi:release factor glutamine methyltransferase
VTETPAVWRDLLARADARVPHREAVWLVERASGREGAELLADLDEPVPGRVVPFFDDMLDRRVAGEPLQYVLGQWSFRRLDIMVDRRVLIPRPETEQVVDVALGELTRLAAERVTVADLGTGSGVIALSIALEVPGATVFATDRSPDALAVARANLTGLGMRGASRVRMFEGEWFDALPGEHRGGLDLVVTNPPYVAAGEDLPKEVAAWEPAEALIAGPTGLEAIERIVTEAPAWLARPGALVAELAPHQADAALAMARAAGFDDARVEPDLSGRPRALVGRFG